MLVVSQCAVLQYMCKEKITILSLVVLISKHIYIYIYVCVCVCETKQMMDILLEFKGMETKG